MGSETVLFFDIGNVLLRFDPGAAARRIAWALGRHSIRAAKLWKAGFIEQVERGELAGEQIYELFRRELSYKGSFIAFRRLWCGPFSLIRPTAALFAKLARRHPVYILSNTNSLHYEFISGRYAFPSQARGAVLSYELGMRKPERRIYEAALRVAGAPPERCIFIDDRPENVAAARELGIRAIRYTRHDALVRDLTALGVV